MDSCARWVLISPPPAPQSSTLIIWFELLFRSGRVLGTTNREITACSTEDNRWRGRQLGCITALCCKCKKEQRSLESGVSCCEWLQQQQQKSPSVPGGASSRRNVGRMMDVVFVTPTSCRQRRSAHTSIFFRPASASRLLRSWTKWDGW